MCFKNIWWRHFCKCLSKAICSGFKAEHTKKVFIRQRRKWLGAFTWITGTQQTKQEPQLYKYSTELRDPMTGLDSKDTTAMIAFLLLALVPLSAALPLPSTNSDKLLLAEVGPADLIFKLKWVNFYFPINACKAKNDFFYIFKQKYLRRFYGLPAGLQGRRRSSDAFQTKIKEMQKFFKLKVTRWRKTFTYRAS